MTRHEVCQAHRHAAGILQMQQVSGTFKNKWLHVRQPLESQFLSLMKPCIAVGSEHGKGWLHDTPCFVWSERPLPQRGQLVFKRK